MSLLKAISFDMELVNFRQLILYFLCSEKRLKFYFEANKSG